MRTAAIFLCVCVLQAPAQAPFEVLGNFQPGWDSAWNTEQLGGRETRYRVVRDEDEWVLRVDSDAAATALFRRLELPGGITQVSWRRISWRWKVDHSLTGERDETQRDGDDYAARLFVIFGDGELNLDTHALCYVWAAGKPVGSSYRSPYVAGVQTVVLQSGNERAGEWVREARDFVADYRRAFGEDPAAVAAIALMVDTDDTGGRATAWYDDVVVR